MNHRPLRVAQLIRDHLALMLVREFEFEHALVTVTEVDVASNIATAVIGVSIIPESRAEGVLHALQRDTRRIEHELFKKLNIRPMPHLSFALDHGPENAAKV
jgi:ribosome-binding factor A